MKNYIFIILFLLPFMAKAENDWEQSLKDSLNQMASWLTANLTPWEVPTRTFIVEDYGAKADGKTINTQAIQQAIDACSAAGGGRVLLSKGDYLSGTIDLKNGVMLEVGKNSRLLGSTDLKDYTTHIAKNETVMDTWMNMKYSLIFAEQCERIGICGEGIIDGQGDIRNFPGEETAAAISDRPFLIRIIECKDVTISGIKLRCSAGWMQNYLNSDNIIIQNIRVENHCNWNNDGIDLDGCRNVIVRNCHLNVEDDGICFKGSGMRNAYNILIENCTVYTECNAMKFGTDSQGGIRNVYVRNVSLNGVGPEQNSFRRRRSCSTGISWMSVDGGTVENLYVKDCQINRATAPFFLRLADRGRTKPSLPKPSPGIVRHLIFENITGVENGARPSIIHGIKGHPVRDIVFNNITLQVKGGGTAQDAKSSVPDQTGVYPDAQEYPLMMPAHGFWMEHAENIELRNVQLIPQQTELRPFIKKSKGVKP